MRTKARFFSLIVFIFFIQIILVSVAAAATKIMPLGDSITLGNEDLIPNPDEWVGYRETLYSDLIDQGYDIDFVGSQDNGSFADPWHEGHGGFAADGIRDNVYLNGSDYLGSNPADVILLHIGTNDISDNQPTDGIVDEVEQILVKIDEYEVDIGKDVPVLLALIILRDDDKNPNTIAFNNEVREMAELRIAGGDNIIIVDMQNALLYPEDLADNYHPNSTGYNKMADVWFDALVQILPDPDPDPDPDPPNNSSGGGGGCFIGSATY